MTVLTRKRGLPILVEPNTTHVGDDRDVQALASALAHAVDGEVRFDGATRGLYAADASNYRHVPIGVVFPTSAEDLAAAIHVCAEFGAPILARGGGTSLAGQCCNVAVVFDTTKYMRGIVDIDASARRARVLPGCVLDDLNEELKKHSLRYGPDPATHAHCTFGGMIGNNSCGPHSVVAGRTADNVRSLEILTYDGLRMTVGATSEEELAAIIEGGGRRGEIYAGLRGLRDRYADEIRRRYPKIPRRVSGYNLDELLPENGFHVARALVGSEGTCVTILEATVDLIDRPPHTALCVVGYDDVYAAADHVADVLAAKPTACEGLDRRLVQHAQKKHLHEDALRELPAGDGWLLVEFGGASPDEAKAKAEDLAARIRRREHPREVIVYADVHRQHQVWEVRESGLGATARVPGEADAWPGWEDSAVPPERLGDYLRDFRALLQRYDYDAALYGHFGQGCLHCRIDFDIGDRDGVARYRAFVDDAADLVSAYGGSYSGEHGDGQSRGELLPKMFGAELVGAMREFKALWDPRGKMNPGRVVDPAPITSGLRVGPEVRLRQEMTHFAYPHDDGKLSRAVERCVGVGKCRNEVSGTMCPSWRATHEERHSTRGRAHLLFEMLEGDVVTDGWRDEGVKEALDLCLACKGCKGDCPVNVDVATYKAEFLAHYYEGKLRPRAAFAFGYIDVWSRLAEIWPALANLILRTPPFSTLAKWIAGIHPKRKAPAFARETFRHWFVHRARPASGDGARPVLLWPDTFNDHFFPDILKAAVLVLEAAGFDVAIPPQPLCCGRPVYDFGMLTRAKALLARDLDVLAPFLARDVPLVALEPSCLSVFQDESVALFPDDPRAHKAAQTSHTLAQFLVDNAPDFPAHTAAGHVVIHGHCHQKALSSMNAEREILQRAGFDAELLDSGCCGLAGSFGFEKDKYEVSQTIGEDLFRRVASQSADTLVVADGFSCREQLQMGMNVRALHIAEALALTLPEDARRALPSITRAVDAHRGAEGEPLTVSPAAEGEAPARG